MQNNLRSEIAELRSKLSILGSLAPLILVNVPYRTRNILILVNLLKLTKSCETLPFLDKFVKSIGVDGGLIHAVSRMPATLMQSTGVFTLIDDEYELWMKRGAAAHQPEPTRYIVGEDLKVDVDEAHANLLSLALYAKTSMPYELLGLLYGIGHRNKNILKDLDLIKKRSSKLGDIQWSELQIKHEIAQVEDDDETIRREFLERAILDMKIFIVSAMFFIALVRLSESAKAARCAIKVAFPNLKPVECSVVMANLTMAMMYAGITPHILRELNAKFEGHIHENGMSLQEAVNYADKITFGHNEKAKEHINTAREQLGEVAESQMSQIITIIDDILHTQPFQTPIEIKSKNTMTKEFIQQEIVAEAYDQLVGDV